MMRKNSAEITSFETVTLHIGGSRIPIDYEITMKEGEAELTLYGMRYFSGGHDRVPEMRVLFSEKEALSLLNGCDLLSWDGFYGEHPKYVLDGTAFSLEAVVNNKRITANGSENFPKHFWDLENGMREILEQGTK